MNFERTVEWQFGGWPGLSPWLGWTLLLVAAVAGVALTLHFYRDTLRTLSWSQRLIFTALRSGFYLSLLICLAGPARVERLYDSGRDSRIMAVVVDRSQSMSVADARGLTRLSHALQVWKNVEGDALHAFPGLRFFRFSTSLASAPDLESAVTQLDSGGGETHLFGSLGQALQDAPPGGYGGIVSLTDGLDTTDAGPEALAARALQGHTPLYFAVGQNQQAPQESLLVREMSVPHQALRKTRFTTTVLVEAHSARERDVPVSLAVNDQPVAQTALHLHAGTNLIPWAVPVDAGEPGSLQIVCRLGDGAGQESTAAAVPVVAQDKVQILFYQGTLDWSYRFISAALKGDASFAMTGLFSSSLNVSQVVGATPATVPPLTEMPDTTDKLKPYQIVVLSNAVGDELNVDQQKALLDYVHGGGGLLFLLSDTQMGRTFSGTELENALPVIFEAESKRESNSESLQQFQDMMHSIGGSDPNEEGNFVANAQPEAPDPLQTFMLPTNYKHSDLAGLFNGTLKNIPQFSTYAHVHGLKAGSEVLAVHPQDKTDTGAARALLVTQRFGQGQVTVLLTDALWRWRMALPSTVHDPEVFWQQLFLALSHSGSGTAGLRYGVQPFSGSLDQTCVFRLDGAQGAAAPNITAVSPSGVSQSIAAQPAAQAGSWSFQLIPHEPGKWRIRAQDDRGAMMETLLRISNASHAAELSGLPADLDGLRKLAEETGGSLLNDGVPENWSSANAPALTSLLSKHSEPLWNTWAVLLLGLGLYVIELVWRRFAKLL